MVEVACRGPNVYALETDIETGPLAGQSYSAPSSPGFKETAAPARLNGQEGGASEAPIDERAERGAGDDFNECPGAQIISATQPGSYTRPLFTEPFRDGRLQRVCTSLPRAAVRKPRSSVLRLSKFSRQTVACSACLFLPDTARVTLRDSQRRRDAPQIALTINAGKKAPGACGGPFDRLMRYVGRYL
ncbi:hypothetical protein AAFF_G00123480 [Aldrovandia affinis]|uniref:Uncharacterized protein n=1 Tax=Aldrovandia affinis TaxID=143900 RepID=A0AAD7W9S3_9TELE|nr:hypothetical protein AAFF_G00123480 [Aldrovandia affinis]